jgi:hypothetical protein
MLDETSTEEPDAGDEFDEDFIAVSASGSIIAQVHRYVAEEMHKPDPDMATIVLRLTAVKVNFRDNATDFWARQLMERRQLHPNWPDAPITPHLTASGAASDTDSPLANLAAVERQLDC